MHKNTSQFKFNVHKSTQPCTAWGMDYVISLLAFCPRWDSYIHVFLNLLEMSPRVHAHGVPNFAISVSVAIK